VPYPPFQSVFDFLFFLFPLYFRVEVPRPFCFENLFASLNPRSDPFPLSFLPVCKKSGPPAWFELLLCLLRRATALTLLPFPLFFPPFFSVDFPCLDVSWLAFLPGSRVHHSLFHPFPKLRFFPRPVFFRYLIWIAIRTSDCFFPDFFPYFCFCYFDFPLSTMIKVMGAFKILLFPHH